MGKPTGRPTGRPKGSGKGLDVLLGLRLHPDVVAALDAEAAATGKGRHVIAREILERWARRHAKQRPPPADP